MELKEEMGKPMVTAGDFHTPLSATDGTIREPGRTQKNSTIHQPTDLISIFEHFIQQQNIYSFQEDK